MRNSFLKRLSKLFCVIGVVIFFVWAWSGFPVPSQRSPSRALLIEELAPESAARTLKIKIVAIEITYGVRGRPIPVFLYYRLGDTKEWSPLQEGSRSVTTGSEYEINLGSITGHVSFRATIPAANWLSSRRSFDTSSTNAIILRSGESITERLSGIGSPFRGQADLTTLLEPFVDKGTQKLQLHQNEFVVLMELGSSNPYFSDFDMQDLVFYGRVDKSQ